MENIMLKILTVIGFGSALMLAPVLAFADDAAPAPDAKMAPAPMMHHRHHHHMMHHHMMMHHHTMHHHMMKKPMAAPDAPKS